MLVQLQSQAPTLTPARRGESFADIAQLVVRNLAKVEVASSSLAIRSKPPVQSHMIRAHEGRLQANTPCYNTVRLAHKPIHTPFIYADVVQRTERSPPKTDAASSNLAIRTNIAKTPRQHASTRVGQTGQETHTPAHTSTNPHHQLDT